MRAVIHLFIIIFVLSNGRTAYGQEYISSLNDDIGLPQMFELPFDTSLFKFKHLKQLTFFTIDNPKEPHFKMEIDAKGQIISANGCYFTNDDLCSQRINARIHYQTDGKIGSTIFIYDYRASTFYDSTFYEYKDGKIYLSYKASVDLTRRDTSNYFSRFSYSPDGKLIKRELINSQNKVEEILRLKYSANGKISYKEYQTAFGTLVDETSYTYNADSLLSQESLTRNGKLQYTHAYSYTPLKQIKSIEYTNDIQLLIHTDFYKYNKKNQLVDKYREYQDENRKGEVTQYQYDKHGNVEKMTLKYANNTPIAICTYEYNSDGNLKGIAIKKSRDELVSGFIVVGE